MATNTNSNNNSNTNSNSNTNDIKNAGKLRTMYIAGFVVFLLLIFLFYKYNPYQLFTKYTGLSLFITLFCFLFLVTMIFFYDYLSKNQGISSASIPSNFSTAIFYTAFTFLLVVFLLWCLQYLYYKLSATNIGKFIISCVLIIAALTIVYKIITLTSLNKTPLFKSIMNILLFIPSLFLMLFGFVYTNTTKTIVPFLFLVIILFILYLIYPIITSAIFRQGGEQLVNQPIPLNSEDIIATYQTLNADNKYDYQYALSFWFYLDSAPPSTNSAYSSTEYANILSYGKNPMIRYNPLTNTLLITIEADPNKPLSILETTQKLEGKLTNATEEQLERIQKEIKQNIQLVKTTPVVTELDSSGNRIIYLKPDILLQKWNNVIINYQGGTLDVFYNGELVKSEIEVVPYVTFDSMVVGQNNGLRGEVANILYFKKPLDIFKIRKLYEPLKDKNPPSLTDDKRTIITKNIVK